MPGPPIAYFERRGRFGQPKQANTNAESRRENIALYTTILVWTTRLKRYLDGAAKSPVAVDFYNTPFHTTCNCCTTLPPTTCETVPPESVALSTDPALSCE